MTRRGVLLARSSRLTIWNNDFSHLSELGVGLYRSTHNAVMHNRVDWCVRGYSHGFYARGQDSAALLMFEQSSDNVVACNSMTHGGDGRFLWAGQQTMNSGTGGSNRNTFFWTTCRWTAGWNCGSSSPGADCCRTPCRWGRDGPNNCPTAGTTLQSSAVRTSSAAPVTS